MPFDLCVQYYKLLKPICIQKYFQEKQETKLCYGQFFRQLQSPQGFVALNQQAFFVNLPLKLLICSFVDSRI